MERGIPPSPYETDSKLLGLSLSAVLEVVDFLSPRLVKGMDLKYVHYPPLYDDYAMEAFEGDRITALLNEQDFCRIMLLFMLKEGIEIVSLVGFVD